MGVHSKKLGLRVIDLLCEFGTILGYYVKKEDPMFNGTRTSSELDVTWRKDKNAKYPLFIFEVESLPSKSASDNAMKVFSRKTPLFQKPLFFFHVFVDKEYETERINYLSSSYDTQNYKNYLLSDKEDSKALIKDIIEQHLRIENHIDIYSLIFLMADASPIRININEFLDILIEVGYDKMETSNFLMTLEVAIVNDSVYNIHEFYLNYLNSFLSNPTYIHQNYNYSVPIGYSEVIHNGIHLLMNDVADEKLVFEKLLIIERKFKPFELWAPYFGLSYDHDLLLLSEFPLILTLLSISFKNEEYSKYFNGKTVEILKESIKKMGYTNLNKHGLTWLLFASRITKDENNYSFAKDIINDSGGIDKKFINSPKLNLLVESDEQFMYNNKVKIPSYNDWPNFLNRETNRIEKTALLKGLLECLLIQNDFEFGYEVFAKYCLNRSI